MKPANKEIAEATRKATAPPAARVRRRSRRSKRRPRRTPSIRHLEVRLHRNLLALEDASQLK
jgi:hypothetical protein